MPSAGGKLVVRVVEDESAIADMARLFLEREDVVVLMTINDFGRMLTPGPWEDVDVAVVDYMLGGAITGDVILRYLADTHPTIRRVMFSAVGSLESTDTTYADAVVLKPSSPEDLWRAVRGD